MIVSISGLKFDPKYNCIIKIKINKIIILKCYDYLYKILG